MALSPGAQQVLSAQDPANKSLAPTPGIVEEHSSTVLDVEPAIVPPPAVAAPVKNVNLRVMPTEEELNDRVDEIERRIVVENEDAPCEGNGWFQALFCENPDAEISNSLTNVLAFLIVAAMLLFGAMTLGRINMDGRGDGDCSLFGFKFFGCGNKKKKQVGGIFSTGGCDRPDPSELAEAKIPFSGGGCDPRTWESEADLNGDGEPDTVSGFYNPFDAIKGGCCPEGFKKDKSEKTRYERQLRVEYLKNEARKLLDNSEEGKYERQLRLDQLKNETSKMMEKAKNMFRKD